MINTYNVKVIREPGADPLTGHILEYAEEEMAIDAVSPQSAHRIAQLMTTLKFRGQMMRIIVNGREHLDEAV